jgi:hypothetical protein
MPKPHNCLDHVCTAAEAAAILNVTPARVMTFCRQGRINARLLNDAVWVIDTASLKEFSKQKRKPGRPKE